MRLERLEINGFKSFSDRSELAFDRGVTAIVGPNGCGKSNVADAITWVMGEQSAKSLRGERMEDVIFSGSDARKPTAAAEVRLRLTGVLKTLTGPAFSHAETTPTNGHANGNGHPNGNGHANGHAQVDLPPPVDPAVIAAAEELIQTVGREIEVTRRLYRSGESEYLIDGHVCRLRDVHDLLMDTGLGAKAYAIIEQGKIGMILSSRPTDRRQLIEEAAGITKYKARRRAAELKLEAAHQNLLRVDDIVFEVEKQRGALKRQAAKARRYQRLRDELRRWEKVLFAHKYRRLADVIESTRTRLAEARVREAAAAAHVAEAEADLERLRLEMVDAESRATDARAAAHTAELAVTRQQQQVAFDRDQVGALESRTTSIRAELEGLESRRDPALAVLADRRAALDAADRDRDQAASRFAEASGAYETARREIEGLEADVEAARSEVFSALNSATALRHALEHAATERDRVMANINKLTVEADDVRVQLDRAAGEHAGAAEGLTRAHQALEATRAARAARESELASARIEHEWRARSVRAQEQEIARLEARLKSLEGLQAARAGYSDAPRAVLAQANGKVNQRGAIADYLEVDSGFERAVEAHLGDLLQYVIVEHPEHAAAGFDVVREAGAGRCGFLVAGAEDANAPSAQAEEAVPAELDALTRLSTTVRATGPFADAITRILGDAWIASSYQQAEQASRLSSRSILTMDGVVFRGPRLVSGGSHEDARGILETKAEINELREQIQVERASWSRLSDETTELEATIGRASTAIGALNAEQHKQEKAIVGLEAQLQHASDELSRLRQKAEQLARERQQSDGERDGLDRRQEEARTSIVRLQQEQQSADDRLAMAQRRLFEAREAADALSRGSADAGAAHAALVERAAALSSEVVRLEEAAADLDQRLLALGEELQITSGRLDALRTAIVEGEARLEAELRALDQMRLEVGAADDRVAALRVRSEELEGVLKSARGSLESVRAQVAELDVARATAESDLSHLAAACIDAVQTGLDEVLAEVSALEAAGTVAPDSTRAILAEEIEEEDTAEGDGSAAAPSSQPPAAMTADEAIAQLRGKIERLGPVNMMAIEQFDELESRHAFLTTQRKDLVESIAQTTEAIKRIDETTRHRFHEAFTAINRNFQETFATLFGGGRAGLTLLDENDPLESGIEIIAQPPGKRLQSVQLLSGGEKALTAISLMFGMFKYKPSPFCLLDEIDAPLDDANIGRFVEMLRGMQQHTQFIVITHNRKTMEIADRLYGVTMEEPGVSKLISVQLH